MVTQKSIVVKTKQFWLIRCLLKKASWLKLLVASVVKTVLVDWVVAQKSIVVKRKQFWLIRWLIKKVWWFKQNSFA